MSLKENKKVLGRCSLNHKSNDLKCEYVTENIQVDFNKQYWNLNKEEQDNYLLNSIKINLNDNKTIEYKYFIFNYQVCSQMFIKALGYKTRSKIEYLFRQLKKTNSLNTLKAPIDGRKKNRVPNKTHSIEFMNYLKNFIFSFNPIKTSRKFVINNYKAIDLYKILCKNLNYSFNYKDNNIRITKNNSKIIFNQNICDDSLTNNSTLFINEVSESNHSLINEIKVTDKKINSIDTDNFNLFLDKNLEKNDEICSFSFFLRFVKKNNFEFKHIEN